MIPHLAFMNSFVNIKDRHFNNCLIKYPYEKKLFKLRENVNELFFNRHLNKSMIAKKKKVSRPFVIKWTKSSEQNFTEDNRGWENCEMPRYDNGDGLRLAERLVPR